MPRTSLSGSPCSPPASELSWRSRLHALGLERAHAGQVRDERVLLLGVRILVQEDLDLLGEGLGVDVAALDPVAQVLSLPSPLLGEPRPGAQRELDAADDEQPDDEDHEGPTHRTRVDGRVTTCVAEASSAGGGTGAG